MIKQLITAILLAVACCNGEYIIPAETECIDSSKINRNAVCIDIYQPVCGCDGNIYENSCVAEAAGLTSWSVECLENKDY